MPQAGLDAFWDMVDGVLVINLDTRPDRWQDVQARTAGLIPPEKLHRLSATLGMSLPGFGAAPWFRGRKRDKTWAGRAGCALSHRAAVARAREAGWRTVLILEDDIEFEPALAEVLARLPGALGNANSDVCYLGFTDPIPPCRALAELPAGHRLYAVAGCNTAHAYLLTERTFDWLLERLPTRERIWPWISRHRAIDRWYYRNLARRFTVSVVSPSIVNQQVGFSDITQRPTGTVHTTRVLDTQYAPLVYRVLGGLRWLGYRLAEPRDWLRGRIKRLNGF